MPVDLEETPKRQSSKDARTTSIYLSADLLAKVEIGMARTGKTRYEYIMSAIRYVADKE